MLASYTLYILQDVRVMLSLLLCEMTQCIYFLALCANCSEKDFFFFKQSHLCLFSPIFTSHKRIDVQSFKAYLTFPSTHNF